jgi:hypothetical protein
MSVKWALKKILFFEGTDILIRVKWHVLDLQTLQLCKPPTLLRNMTYQIDLVIYACITTVTLNDLLQFLFINVYLFVDGWGFIL